MGLTSTLRLVLKLIINLTMCELLLAYMIVGAIESTPGTMTVDQLVSYDEAPVIRTLLIPTNEYLECFEQPISL
jgi:hypothetical protein